MIRKLVNKLGFDVVRFPHRGGFEWHVLQLFEHLRIDTVIDVGANNGQYALLLRSLGYSGWIYSFEPVSSIFNLLSARMSDDGHWRGFNVALGEIEGRHSINVAAGDGQASSFLSFKEDGAERWGNAHRVAKTEEVAVRRLEDVLQEIIQDRPNARIYLKLDTQGLDLDVLRSAGDGISLVVGLQSEIAAHHFYDGMIPFGEAVTEYQKFGFEITGIFPLSRELDNLRVIEFDFVFMRRLHDPAKPPSKPFGESEDGQRRI